MDREDKHSHLLSLYAQSNLGILKDSESCIELLCEEIRLSFDIDKPELDIVEATKLLCKQIHNNSNEIFRLRRSMKCSVSGGHTFIFYDKYLEHETSPTQYYFQCSKCGFVYNKIECDLSAVELKLAHKTKD
jgi:hypothetical protein